MTVVFISALSAADLLLGRRGLDEIIEHTVACCLLTKELCDFSPIIEEPVFSFLLSLKARLRVTKMSKLSTKSATRINRSRVIE